MADSDYKWDTPPVPALDKRYASVQNIGGGLLWEQGAQKIMRRAPQLGLNEGRAWLDGLRGLPKPTLECPRVFVSHKQADANWALRIAWLAHDEGFDYWLDVLDLDPAVNAQMVRIEVALGRKLTPFEVNILTAATIEMALINCSHVIAVMTSNTVSSRWVPYEYGRVRQDRLFTENVACWRNARQIAAAAMPEYCHLAPIHRNERRIRKWFKTERSKFTSCNREKGLWEPVPDPLPTG